MTDALGVCSMMRCTSDPLRIRMASGVRSRRHSSGRRNFQSRMGNCTLRTLMFTRGALVSRYVSQPASGICFTYMRNCDYFATFGCWNGKDDVQSLNLRDVLVRDSGSRVEKPTSVTMLWTGMWKQAAVTRLPSTGKEMTLVWMLH